MFDTDGILNNAEKAVDEAKISSMQTQIKSVIAKLIYESHKDITINQIIEALEKQGIINIGDSNSETGEVKTQPDGYVFQIKETANDWEVIYIGTGDITPSEIVLVLSQNTKGLTNEVIITMTAKAESGIASYTLPKGTPQSVDSGTKEITQTVTATENGTYVFTVVNGNGEEVTKSIRIDNILKDTIQMSPDTTLPAAKVTVTITWPEDSYKAIKEIRVGDGEWQTVTGSTSQITVTDNCTIRARVKNSTTSIMANAITISNIDKAQPIVTGMATTVDYGKSNDISQFFIIEENGIGAITDVKYINTSNGDVEIQNTNVLTVGTHAIKCIATKETGVTGSGIASITVEPGVFGNLYKISDTEYHLIFNGTGAIAEGYTEAQLVARGTDIKGGIPVTTNSEGIEEIQQPWQPYLGNITKVKIEDKLKPTSTANYFHGLTQITGIEGLENLDTSNVDSMWNMFKYCSSITSLDLSGFDTSKVGDFVGTFFECSGLTSLNVSNWNTSNVQSMHGTFHGCTKIVELDLSNWDTSNVDSFEISFTNCRSLTNLNISEWNTDKVTIMKQVFDNCDGLTNLDLSNWNTSNVTNMLGMFNDCTNLQKIYVGNDWSTNAVIISDWMFENCTKLSGAISYDSTKIDANYANWTTGYLTKKGVYGNLYKISDTEYHLIFNSTGALAQGYTESQLVARGTDIENGSGYIESSEVGRYISDQPWGPYLNNILKVKIEEKIKPKSTAHYFNGLSKITEIEGFSNLDVSKVTSMWSMFQECSSLTNLDVSNWDTTNVTNIEDMFWLCSNLINLDVSNWNTENIENMQGTFSDCSSLTKLDVENWNTIKVKDMGSMFKECNSLTELDVSNWNTSSVTQMYHMFYRCHSLIELNANNWNTSNVTTMNHMFCECHSLTELNISEWDTSNVTTFETMFYKCKSLKSLNLSNWNTDKLNVMLNTFNFCSNLTNIYLNNWDTSKVTDMRGTFAECTNLRKIYVGDKWSTKAVAISDCMFLNCTNLSGAISYDENKLDATYANWTTGYLTKGEIIPISTKEQLLKIGTEEVVEIDGKQYTFGTGFLYELKNSFEFIGNGYDETATRIRENNIGIIGNNNQIVVTTASGEKEYYTENSKYCIAVNKYGYVLDGLVLYYDGIDNKGTGEHSVITTTWKDLSGNNRDGILTGINTINTGAWEDEGLYFDGKDDYVETTLSQETLVENNDEFTFEILLRARTTSTYGDIIGYHINDTSAEETESNRGVVVQLERDGLKLMYGTKNNTWAGSTIDRNHILEITENKVVFKDVELTVVYSINNYIKTYVNGVLIKEEKVDENFNVADKFRIGGNGYYSEDDISTLDRYFNGTIKCVKVYNKALSEDEIQVNYSNTEKRYNWEEEVYNSTVIDTGLPSEIVLSGSVAVPVVKSQLLSLDKTKMYMISFEATDSAAGKNTFNVDLNPDDLPEKHVVYAANAHYTEIIFQSTSDNMANCYLRFFDDIQEENEGDTIITNVVLRELSK